MAFPADREVGVVPANQNLLAVIYGLPINDPKVHDSFPLTEPADRFHFLDFIGVNQHPAAAFKQLVAEIILQPEAHYRHVKLIYNPNKLKDAILGKELAFIHQNAVWLRLMVLHDAVDIGAFRNGYRFPAQTDA